MTRNQRARRVAKLCCHCVRNAAYYRAGWRNQNILANDDFLVGANSNFLDLAVLEWCKLFTDQQGKHHWRKVIPDAVGFLPALQADLGVPAHTFEGHCEEMKAYRDKFVAHLDDDLRMQIPNLTMTIDSTIYLYRIVRLEFAAVLGDAPQNLRTFYHQRLAHGRAFYPGAA